MTDETRKRPSKKEGEGKFCGDDSWTVVAGKLMPVSPSERDADSLFKAIGEKIPFRFISNVKKKFKAENLDCRGVYIAHDSMGYPRYIGRGDIFARLSARKNAQKLELEYFSFFIVEDKTHEREIETIMIRAAGPLLYFNSKKVRSDIQAGDVRDFEPGTRYIERQYKKGKKSRANRGAKKPL